LLKALSLFFTLAFVFLQGCSSNGLDHSPPRITRISESDIRAFDRSMDLTLISRDLELYAMHLSEGFFFSEGELAETQIRMGRQEYLEKVKGLFLEATSIATDSKIIKAEIDEGGKVARVRVMQTNKITLQGRTQLSVSIFEIDLVVENGYLVADKFHVTNSFFGYL